jgi:1,2-diacylglycerol 3-beta-galactosyltransferase
MTKHRPSIALIYADTGGGHRSTAQAVAVGLDQLYGERVRVSLVNACPFMPFPYNQAERAYPLAIARARAGYALFWKITNNAPYANFTRAAMRVSGSRLISAFFDAHPADVYVSCHPLVNQLLPSAAKRLRPASRFLAVVSDLFTVHALFWSTWIDHVMVATDAARALALRYGLSPDRVSVMGQPVLPNFAVRAQAGKSQRAELGLSADRTTVLLTGGGDGMGRMLETALAIAHSDLPIQLVIACGRNEHVREKLSTLATGMPVRVLGYTERMPEYMGAADVLVTKAGPGSICEGFVAGLPMIVFDAVPGQETGNISFVEASGAGVWRPTPDAVVEQLRRWLADPSALHRARAAALTHAQPEAALNVARLAGTYALSPIGHWPRPPAYRYELNAYTRT